MIVETHRAPLGGKRTGRAVRFKSAYRQGGHGSNEKQAADVDDDETSHPDEMGVVQRLRSSTPGRAGALAASPLLARSNLLIGLPPSNDPDEGSSALGVLALDRWQR